MQSSGLNLKPGVTWKAVLTTICLMPFSFYWIIAGEIGLVGYALNTYAVPFYNVVFTLFLLMGLQGRFIILLRDIYMQQLYVAYLLDSFT